MGRLALRVFAAILLSLGTAAHANICPAVGQNTDCGTVITITDSGITISNNQGPYDGNDDTLVAVVNNSSVPITSITITSASPIFGFDNDGICGTDPNTGLPFNPAPQGCPFGPTGYEGPGTIFSATTTNSGTITFTKPIKAKTGSAYFSLEAALSTANASCADIINNSVKHKLWSAGGGTNNYITATFIPNFGYTLAQAAKICNFTEFDWQQTITNWPAPGGLFAYKNPPPAVPIPLVAPPAFNDYIVPDGYTYCNPDCAVKINTYWNVYTSGNFLSVDTNSKNPVYPTAGDVCGTAGAASGSCLGFLDTPSNPCLPVPGTGNPSPVLVNYVQANQNQLCQGDYTKALSYVYKTKPYYYAPKGSHASFTTHLVGIQGALPGVSIKDTGIGFSWTSDYNGTTGGIPGVTGPAVGPIGFLEADANSGTGGIAIVQVSDTTSYQYPSSVNIVAINGLPVNFPPVPSNLLSSSQIAYSSSGLAYSRVSNSFTGNITIKNISSSVIVGPFQMVLDSLTSGVALSSATGSFGGWPFITIPSTGTLQPGESTTATIKFTNPSKGAINFVPLIYTGGFN